MTQERQSGISNVEKYELPNGDWRLDYQAIGGDYSVVFAGSDAELRLNAYLYWIVNEPQPYHSPAETSQGECPKCGLFHGETGCTATL